MRIRRFVASTIALIIGASGLALLGAPEAAAAPELPAGFVLTELPSGLAPTDLLTNFAYLPDRSMITIGKTGKVAWVSADGRTTRQLARITVNTSQDRGLVGIEVAADYATSRHIYLVYHQTVNGQVMDRTVEWAVTGAPEPTGIGSPRVVLEVPSTYFAHNMTTVLDAGDGTLWVSMGDSSEFNPVDPRALRAQDPDTPYGKLLRITPDGDGAPSNPFYDPAAPASWRSRVYAMGFRSPFRFSLDPGSGAPLVGDVGWNTTEEVNLVRPGTNFGWPCWEGNSRAPGYSDLPGCAGVGHTAPIISYPRAMGSSVTGGVVYTGTSYPPAYRGAYFFADYAEQRLYTAQLGPTGEVLRAPEPVGFARNVPSPVKVGTGPNGDIVMADIAGSTVLRLSYTPGNRPPAARATSTTTPTTRTVEFDAAASFDLDGDALNYQWDFGDGNTGTGVSATHGYPPSPETFTATLTVTDPAGATATTQLTVAPANNAPAISLTGPPAGHTYAVGDEVMATATASDVEDGALTVHWSTQLVHCRGATCHLHPGLAVEGPEYRTPFTDHDDETRMEVTATATDSRGVSTSGTFVARPRLRMLTLSAETPATMTINGNHATTAMIIANAVVSFAAPDVATDGVATFDGWSDGGAKIRGGFVMPDSDVTLNAAYRTPIDRRYDSGQALRALVGAPLAPEEGDATVRWRVHERGRLYWTPAAGVHEVHGDILASYLEAGGHQRFGEPVTDETGTPDGVGRYNHFAGGASVYWTPETGAHEVHGLVRQAWQRSGWETGPCGYPTTDETKVADGVGRYNHFTKGCSIYWTLSTGAHVVYGSIRQAWQASGSETGPCGYPTTDETGTPDGVGRYNHFTKGCSIYWTPGTGAHLVYGLIRQAWQASGWETGPCGYPTNDETGTPDGVGRYNHFTKGCSIYWTPGTGAHLVYGAIRQRWSALGWERSYLGYPTTDESGIPGGRRSDFQFGYITWKASDGAVTDRRY